VSTRSWSSALVCRVGGGEGVGERSRRIGELRSVGVVALAAVPRTPEQRDDSRRVWVAAVHASECVVLRISRRGLVCVVVRDLGQCFDQTGVRSTFEDVDSVAEAVGIDLIGLSAEISG
jgi:hypothetical protein